ncbi:PREDICTED: cysteine-rich repeat secretory protein 38-like [Ipomoea nil]|uniref:cysteine-rich repeat secretory protein 38-like n=1 Tax=Ipomoea nil TaxID=35883 RepID=UPI0009009947|nr:PREDICTED: cysteine-rich repeat secretory protein 38-like [Ipomoea nil]
MANSKLFCLLPLLFIAAVVLTKQTAMAADPLRYYCLNFEISITKSDYQNNVNKLLGDLTSQTPINGGFSSGSVGQYSSKVYALALCRGDVSSTDCKSCLTDARTKIIQVCRKYIEAIIWYDNCLLKYNGKDFFGIIDEHNKFYLWNPKPVSNPGIFIPKRNELLRQLAAKAAGQKSFYAAGVANAGESVEVYGLVQCTRDLSSKYCRSCLNDAIAELPKCCGSKQGGRVVEGSCSVRYEIYPFFKFD